MSQLENADTFEMGELWRHPAKTSSKPEQVQQTGGQLPSLSLLMLLLLLHSWQHSRNGMQSWRQSGCM
jgi:hypothetical protein